jgi:hypothetical protein
MEENPHILVLSHALCHRTMYLYTEWHRSRGDVKIFLCCLVSVPTTFKRGDEKCHVSEAPSPEPNSSPKHSECYKLPPQPGHVNQDRLEMKALSFLYSGTVETVN